MSAKVFCPHQPPFSNEIEKKKQIENVWWRGVFSISFKNGRWLGQATHDDTSRRHNFSIKKKIVEIRLMVVASELSKGIENVQWERVFRFRSKIGVVVVGGGEATFDDISRRHKLLYETKLVKIGRVVEAGGLGEEFFTKSF
ncbi:hypothetical protein AVEN_144645-1 [Araneus ventricosus]|uniref:Uncharacterized protein n=1 Tax=Araneus ventricosus TaxID=182803 RepID=A0A4Y2E0U3_ARAVE|nr:hypothetical protein AVEN_144645-1 [Araneus ventricosus]